MVESIQDIPSNSRPRLCDWNNFIKKIKRIIKSFLKKIKIMLTCQTCDLNC
jgi:hypothetical protein